jgi:acetyl-CoA C-acetyltransferase
MGDIVVDLRKAMAVVGVYEHPVRYAPDKNVLNLIGESALGALADAGLNMKDVDAYYNASEPPRMGYELVEYLNINPWTVDTTLVGGASFEFHVNHALSMIATGKARVALITYGSVSRSRGVAVGTAGSGRYSDGPALLNHIPDSFEAVYGATTVGEYALVAQRHMHNYGTRPEQLAEIAVAARKHAGLNPYAVFRDPIVVEDVLNAPLVSSPLHLLDCCIISDGGGAVVLASPEVARNCRKEPVWILGSSESIAHTSLGKRDFTTSVARQTGPRAMEYAGVTHDDIDIAMIYDSFTITVLITLEDLGFCEKGDGGEFVSGGRIALGGELPINTDGGGLSSNHPGMRGIFLLIEAVRQLRAERGDAQVPDCKIALCHGTGGRLGTRHSGGTVILAKD